jgi:hypothetical protein
MNLPMKYIKVIAIDGVYIGYPDKSPLSDDGSRELVRSYQDRYGKERIELWDFPSLHERFKRQKYVDIASRQGIPFLFILDSDEYVECKSPADFLDELRAIDREWHRREEIFKDKTIPQPDGKATMPHISNVHSVKFIDLTDQGYIINVTPRPRLWYHPGDMEYKGRHYHFGPKRILNDSNYQNLDQSQRLGFVIQESSKYKSFIIENMQCWHDHSLRTDEREKKRYLYEQERLPRLEHD